MDREIFTIVGSIGLAVAVLWLFLSLGSRSRRNAARERSLERLRSDGA